MKKMTIADAAEYFKVSKEAIHNRIRRGSLDCIVDNGVKYVAVETAKSNAGTNIVSDSRYTQYIEQENERLREKVDSLEKETSRLRDQREQMLIDERVKVEQIYKERDAQLRSVLHVVATKFLSHVNTDTVMQEGMTVDAINADIVDSEIEEWISLKSFLKLKRVKDKEKKQIKRGFETALKNGDERLIPRGDKIFLNPSKFDYSDLLE
ncbi:DNA-binding protein [Sulfuricurvum sp.]|uniref:DNA-binding protein n=1 Tax=Sulfuricurvum sp. TaxID=2025608 RepID=UPI0026224C2F|nr:DNA-binding protein [Sulfuricurvum sp.]MDD2265797.1 DNA-binding protein [Sulfuricurvum sp.]MDD2783522.1 DNA-binding protein [Sulfuricurvum sp.]HZF71563.1 DNA-binding protein [Sulfuricurvum sp.]